MEIILALPVARSAVPTTGRDLMIRLIAIAVALALTSSVQALPLATLHQSDQMATKVREACGAGMHRVNGVCIRTHAHRAASRCARGVTC